jgi:aryl-alcohol dehydrogenase-like predicted oxidoreductase
MDAPRLIEGRATLAGTQRFAARFAQLPGHFRCPDGLWLGSIGMGTRGGEPGGAGDLGYRSAVGRALELGCNVFDTAISYRLMTSERALGAGLARAFAKGVAQRDEVFVISKCGYLTVDPDHPLVQRDPRRYLIETYVDTGLIDPHELVNGVHALTPAFVRDQIRRSRENLGLATIDLYCLDEPELHLLALGPDLFHERLRAVFAELETAVRAREIGAYGVASWSGLLTPHTEKGHLSLVELFGLALDVGGGDHHLRGIALPYGLALTDAHIVEAQFGPEGVQAALDVVRDTGTAVFAAAPLARGRALRRLPEFVAEHLPGLAGDAQRCIQFARSTPGVTSALVGLCDLDHVAHALALAQKDPAQPQAIEAIFEAAAALR